MCDSILLNAIVVLFVKGLIVNKLEGNRTKKLNGFFIENCSAVAMEISMRQSPVSQSRSF